jgi:hypothetical protein
MKKPETQSGGSLEPVGSGMDLLWLIVLPVAIAAAFTLGFPLDMIQAICCALLLGLKLGKRLRPNALRQARRAPELG